MRNVFSEIQFLISSVQCTLHTHFHCGTIQIHPIQFLSKSNFPGIAWEVVLKAGYLVKENSCGVVSVFLPVKEFCCLEGCLL